MVLAPFGGAPCSGNRGVCVWLTCSRAYSNPTLIDIILKQGLVGAQLRATRECGSLSKRPVENRALLQFQAGSDCTEIVVWLTLTPQ